MSVRTYEFEKYVLTIGTHIVRGFIDGTGIEAERNEDTYNLSVGIDGEASRAKTANKSGLINIYLQQTSLSNDVLSNIAFIGEEVGGNADIRPLLLKDLIGTTVLSASSCWLARPANITLSKEIGPRNWTLVCAKLQIKVGSNPLI